MTTFEYDHDVFVSYAHTDNEPRADLGSWVDTLVKAIKVEHARFSPQPLRVFFDKETIRVMDDWDFRIKSALVTSRAMLAIVSPAYFSSRYCELEWQAFIERETARAMLGEAIAPVYAVDVPELNAEADEQQARWITNIRYRQMADLRSWWDHGPSLLTDPDARRKIEELESALTSKLEQADRIGVSPTTVPVHNRQFSGRVTELRRLRELVSLGNPGQPVIIQALGGMGKSALAFEYAHVTGAAYPGGRYLISCQGMSDLRLAMSQLIEPLAVRVDDGAAKDPAAVHRRILQILATGPRRLLIFDNVDQTDLLSANKLAENLPTGDQLHAIATTRLEPSRFFGLPVMKLNPLPETEAMMLLQNYRNVCGPEEEASARRVTRILDGYPFALEAAAVYLWQNPEVKYSNYAARLEQEGVGAIDAMHEETGLRLSRHAETTLAAVIVPTLETLSDEERATMELAALLPPDFVPLRWLEPIVAARFLSVATPARQGHPDPWLRIERRLTGLRLLTRSAEPQVARIHRLLGDLLRRRTPAERVRDFHATLRTHALVRAAYLQTHWFERGTAWEADGLFSIAHQSLDDGDWEFATKIATTADRAWTWLDKGARARPLFKRLETAMKDAPPAEDPLFASFLTCSAGWAHEWEPSVAYELACRAVAILRKTCPDDRPLMIQALLVRAACENIVDHNDRIATLEEALSLANEEDSHSRSAKAEICNSLGFILIYSDPEKGLGYLEDAVRLARESLPACHPTIAVYLANLSRVESEIGRHESARRHIDEALQIDRTSLDPEHTHFDMHMYSLAEVEKNAGHLDNAHALMLEVIASETKKGAPPLQLAMSYLALAEIAHLAERFAESIESLHRVIELRKGAIDPHHANMFQVYVRLGIDYYRTSKPVDAVKWFREALEIGIASLGPNHHWTETVRKWIHECEETQGHVDP